MVGGARGLIGLRVLQNAIGRHVLKCVVLKESDNASVTLRYLGRVGITVLVTAANKKLVTPVIPQVP